jgi:hypothetical protein
MATAPMTTPHGITINQEPLRAALVAVDPDIVFPETLHVLVLYAL